jgi:hypothetical protein
LSIGSIGKSGSFSNNSERSRKSSDEKSMSFSDRGEKARKSRSFDESSMIAQMHSSFPSLGFSRPVAELSRESHPTIAELSREFEFEEEEPSQEVQVQAVFNSPRRSMMDKMHSSFPSLGFSRPIAELNQESHLEEEEPSFNSPRRDPEVQSKVRFPSIFRKKRSDVSDLTMDETPSTPSRMSSFLDSPARMSSFRRGKKGSDVSNASSDDARNEASLRIGDLFRTKRSEMSVDTTAEPPVNPNGDGRHSRIPGVLRMSLAALKRNSDRNNRDSS